MLFRNPLVIVFGAIALGAAAGDWPHWRGPNWDGTTPEKVSVTWPDGGPKPLWRANVGTGFSSVSVSRGRAYTMGNTNEQDTVWCLNATNGTVLWQHTYKARLDPQFYEGGPSATPTVHEDRVFTISKWGDIFCFDSATGNIVWQRELGLDGVRSNRWGFAGSPYIYKNLVLLNAGSTGMALDRATGRTVWTTGTNVTGYATPVVFEQGGRDVLLIFAQKYLAALRPDTGRELWRYSFQTGYDLNATDPLPFHGKILISSYSRGCALVDPLSNPPETVYTNKNLSAHLSPGILVGDYLYCFNGEAHTKTDFRCVHVPTGEVKWSLSNEPKFGSLIRAGNAFLILSEKGELQAAEASPAGLTVLARAQALTGVCWSPPSLANGCLYARTAKGELVCLDLHWNQ